MYIYIYTYIYPALGHQEPKFLKTFLLPLRIPFLLWVLPFFSVSLISTSSIPPRSIPAPNDSVPFLLFKLEPLFLLELSSISSMAAEVDEGVQVISIPPRSVAWTISSSLKRTLLDLSLELIKCWPNEAFLSTPRVPRVLIGTRLTLGTRTSRSRSFLFWRTRARTWGWSSDAMVNKENKLAG